MRRSAGPAGSACGALRRPIGTPAETSRIGGRLWKAMAGRSLEVRTHPFSCVRLPYQEMPADLRTEFEGVSLTVVEGGLKHRRLVGGRPWDTTTPLARLTASFSGASRRFRTRKSDVVIGLGQKTLDALQRSGTAWRTNGTHVLIQVRRWGNPPGRAAPR
ncbi:ARMT1-like domain-containing protein [Streptomyces sp. MUSC 125]|uniref:ARMT1-like domain-containing protein n=1 Tax=Streptomyces sp. MUSC 125 TaxID=1428624 RepID=UPI002D21EC95|nr:ARMT1-like domain-containing protein [Streptomyces sp. MUSC 125]